MIGSAQFFLVSGERKTDMRPGTWSLVSAWVLCLRLVIDRSGYSRYTGGLRLVMSMMCVGGDMETTTYKICGNITLPRHRRQCGVLGEAGKARSKTSSWPVEMEL